MRRPDSIYNGALDNALGVAVMLEAARELASHARPSRSARCCSSRSPPRRRACSAREWFARRPTVPRASLVANVNMDMPMLLTPTDDVVPIGIEHSSLQPLVQQAAKDVGVALSPDPFPEETVFVRSDQYAFIRAGIPAVYLMAGIAGVAARRRRAVQRCAASCATTTTSPATTCRSRSSTPMPRGWRGSTRASASASAMRRSGRRWNAGDFFGERFGTVTVSAPVQ